MASLSLVLTAQPIVTNQSVPQFTHKMLDMLLNGLSDRWYTQSIYELISEHKNVTFVLSTNEEKYNTINLIVRCVSQICDDMHQTMASIDH